MLSDSDVALARLAGIAYNSTPDGTPAGFYAVGQSALGLKISTGESYGNGLYTNLNGAARVFTATINGQTTAVLDFRGSVNEQDSINDLQNINKQYVLFSNLIATFDAWVAKEGFGQVYVTGHSLGGAMDQLFMSVHADNANVHYLADTFGSPGVLQSAGTDNRITNIRVSDDPAIYLGENRAAVGSELRSNPAFAGAAVFVGPEVFPGLTNGDVIASIGSLSTNYVNRGLNFSLPDSSGQYTTVTSVSSAANSGKPEHLVSTYISRIEAVTGASGDNQVLASITPTTTGSQIFRFFDVRNGTHFYTANTTERDAVVATRTDLTYEGFGLNALPSNPSSDPAAAPVFRFFDVSNGSHLYTTAASEMSSLMANAGFKYEGVAFYEDTAKQTNNSPVYRFFDTADGSHFYTANANEKAQVLSVRGDLVNEGVAFYTLSA